MTIESATNGATYAVYVDELPMYITINQQKIKVFKVKENFIDNAFVWEMKITELFVRIDAKEHFEIVNLITRLASMALRSGVDPLVIAKDLQGVYSMTTQHIIPGTTILCPSIIARIGIVLENHIEFLNEVQKNGTV